MTWEPTGDWDREDSDVFVCPQHLRFVPCRTCPPGKEQFTNDPEVVARARAFQAEEFPACRSLQHRTLPADVEGIFDCSAVNGRPADTKPSAYCTQCAIRLEMGGMFTPSRRLRPVDVAGLEASYAPDVWAYLVAEGLKTLEVIGT